MARASEAGWGGDGRTYVRTDGRTDGRTDSPCVLQDFVPFRAAAQKRGVEKKEKKGDEVL